MRPDFTKLKTHTIRGKAFRLHWRRPDRKSDGQCDHPTTKQKGLWIFPDKDPMELLDTINHELTHGSFPDLDENSVLEHCQSWRRLVTRMGIKVTFEPK